MGFLNGIHHVAYRCKDARNTVDFYREVLEMEFLVAFAEEYVPSTGERDPYMHVFLDAGGGNVLAFFELPERAPMAADHNTPSWVQHIAFKVKDQEALMTAYKRAKARGLDVVGPTDHGIFVSIYFYDPNGHRLELTVDTGTPQEMAELGRVAAAMLEEWTTTRRAPKHAAWLHDKARPQHEIGSEQKP